MTHQGYISNDLISSRIETRTKGWKERYGNHHLFNHHLLLALDFKQTDMFFCFIINDAFPNIPFLNIETTNSKSVSKTKPAM